MTGVTCRSCTALPASASSARRSWTGCPGHEALAPVRVGNGAAHQLQLDVYGEVTEALHLAHMTGLARNDYASLLQLKLISYLEKHWQEPDEGIWEVRGPRRHFVHSKVMAWVAVDRTIKLIESGAADGPLERWKELRDYIHREVCEKGYDKERNTFTQSYGSKELDASLLLIPQVGFLPPDDKLGDGTVEAIQRELSTSDGFILRYPTEGKEEGVDGLPGDAGAFLACSFWMADDLAMIGRVDEARKLFEKLLSLRNDLGLLAEVVGPAPPAPGGQLPAGLRHGQGNGHVQYSFAAHRAVVDVDTELGLVKVVELAGAEDVGKALNPLSVIGQIQGGTTQGLGIAVMEEIVVDPRTAKVRNPSFTDYLIPTILDTPPMPVDVLELADEHAPYGLRGVGEAPTLSSTPGCFRGDPDATGLELNRTPVRPEHSWPDPDKTLRAARQERHSLPAPPGLTPSTAPLAGLGQHD
ncbi:hypothetical protein SGLAM104S_10245 [Streptomyces glaucescens]